MKEIVPILPRSLAPLKPASPEAPQGGNFAAALAEAVTKVNNTQVEADRAVVGMHAGEARNLHEVMIRMEEADISVKLLVQVRNKVVDAYQEIMRMQV